MKYVFKVNSILSRDTKANPQDVLLTKEVLFKTGHYEIPKYGFTSYPDEELFEAIKDFQKENDLKADGIIKPGGPTEKVLAVRGPIIRCPECGGPHGGVKGDLCPSCDEKLS